MATKVTPKKASIRFLVLTSACGQYNQARYYSEHSTEALANAAAQKVQVGQRSYYSNGDGGKSAAFVVKLIGKVEMITTKRVVKIGD